MIEDEGGTGIRASAFRRWFSGFGALALIAAVASPTAAAKWERGPERYAVSEEESTAIKMADGPDLQADVFYPIDPETGERAEGTFPVALMIGPYGEALEGSFPLQGPLPGLVRRGYINAIVELGGTGRSEGTFELFDPRQGREGAAAVRWAANLPGSNGRVGMYGPSYQAWTQYFAAANLPRRSPLRAMFPVVGPNDLYREAAAFGGMVAGGTGVLLFPLFMVAPTASPLVDDDVGDVEHTLSALADHIPGLTQNMVPLAVDFYTGGDVAFDEEFWRTRETGRILRRVTKRRIPTMVVGAWRGVFQRGSLMNFAGHQNAWAGRPVGRPMSARQRVSPRYQVIQGDWTHTTFGRDLPLEETLQRWFDTWLKGKRSTGLRRVKRPVRLYDITRKRWVESKRYPFPEARARTWYIRSDTLSEQRPESANAADTLAFTGVSSPCSGTTDQYLLGFITMALESVGLDNPCVIDDRTTGLGPGARTYTSTPLGRPRTLAGPIGARIYARSTRPEVSLIATLEDVSPSGASRYLTSGGLLGSHRRLDRRRTWYGKDGAPILPYHPYTRAASTPVPVGEVVRYDLEIFPTMATIEAGHSLRLTLSTTDMPHVTPTPEQLVGLVGGVYEVQRNAARASSLSIPMAPPGRFKHPCKICS